MLNTNGNRKPKAFLVKTGVDPKVVWDMRSFLSKGNSADVSKVPGLTKSEALSILAEKQAKNAEIFSLVSGNKSKTVSIYIVEKAAIRSLKRVSGSYSDEVELKPDYYFKDEVVENKKAKMYVLNGKVIVIQHTDEISLFERNNRDAVFVSEVDVKSSTKSSVTVKIEADYRSSAVHAAKLDAAKESEFIHIKPDSGKNTVVVKVYGVEKGKEVYRDRLFTITENLSDLEDGVYKVKDDGVEKVIALATEAFTHTKTFILFNKNDAPIKSKEVKAIA